MTAAIHFPNDLRDWIVRGLAAGHAGPVLAERLSANDMAPQFARALVEAIEHAVRTGAPLPEGSLSVPTEDDYDIGMPRLSAESLIRTADREIRVLARARRPCTAILESVLSEAECDELIALGRPRLAPSTVVDPASGQDRPVTHRSSAGMFFRLQENPLVATLDRRISELMNLPVDNGEGIQLLHYPTHALTTPHFDFLSTGNAANVASLARSGQRVSTLIIYLNDVPAGGATVFPELGWSVLPRKGNAVYFEYVDTRGRCDERSLHAGAPVLAGEKWIATKWMRSRRFVPSGMLASEGMQVTQR
jgi:prolyl 4-hydroxylase